MWLVELVTNPELKAHLNLFTSLMGVQKGNISGRDLIFLEPSYLQRILNTDNQFYNDALLSLTSLDIDKGISHVNQWDREHLFYDKLFSLNMKTRHCISPGISNKKASTHLDNFWKKRLKI